MSPLLHCWPLEQWPWVEEFDSKFRSFVLEENEGDVLGWDMIEEQKFNSGLISWHCPVINQTGVRALPGIQRHSSS